MPPPLLAIIDPSRVTPMGLADGSPQAVLGLGNHDQMHVVGHQAVGPDLDLVLAAPLGHQVQVGLVVVIAEKRLLSTVPPLGHMVRHARNNHSCQSSHAANPAEPPAAVKSYVYCPRNSPSARSEFLLATSWMAAFLSAYVMDDVEPFEPAELEWGFDTTVFDDKLDDAG